MQENRTLGKIYVHTVLQLAKKVFLEKGMFLHSKKVNTAALV